ncbi:MAG: hypothetical protein IKA01_08710 [Alistipes sp.]|nr:hypothetical protein [Alistipes sp.]MBR2629856.1 hypothetical protein [Alistipes sp.]
MGEFNKKWFQTVWMGLLFASLVIDYIQRMSDAQWAHSEAIEMLDTILLWIVFPLTVLLFILHNIQMWRQGARYFWRQWQKGATAILVSGGLAFLLVLIVKKCKGEALEINNEARMIILAIFAVIGLVIALARYKFKHWQGEE